MHTTCNLEKYVYIASSPGLPDFSRVTLKNMGRPGDEATCMYEELFGAVKELKIY